MNPYWRFQDHTGIFAAADNTHQGSYGFYCGLLSAARVEQTIVVLRVRGVCSIVAQIVPDREWQSNSPYGEDLADREARLATAALLSMTIRRSCFGGICRRVSP